MKKISVFFIVIALLSGGCRTSKGSKVNISTTTPSSLQSTESIVKQTIGSHKDISTINIKNAEASLISDGKSYSVRISVKIDKNREINISVLPILGIELFRMQLTPNRVYLFDKLNKNYCDHSYEALSKQAKVDIRYQDIEALLINRLFSIGKNIDHRLFDSQQLSDKYLLVEKDKIGDYAHFFEISPSFNIISTSLNQNNKDIVRINYSDFEMQNDLVFPKSIEVITNFEKNNVYLKIDIKNMIVNKPLGDNNLSLDRYSKVDCQGLLP